MSSSFVARVPYAESHATVREPRFRATVILSMVVSLLVGALTVAPAQPATAADPGPGEVRVGDVVARVAGQDQVRGTDELVVYTPAYGATTGTNQWGAEAAVVDGRVVAFRDRQRDGGSALAIPVDGVVLSGHGASRVLLTEHAAVGAPVVFGDDALNGPPPTPEPEPTPIPAAPSELFVGTAGYPVAGVDVGRGTDELVVYTPAHGVTTGTNQWGAEAAVVDGEVVDFRDRQREGGDPMAIPQDGVVVSGHGAARVFLVENVSVGASVGFDDAPVTDPSPDPAPSPDPEPAPVPDPSPGPSSGLPEGVVGGYWTYWGAPRLRDVPVEFNTVYLFSARPVGGQPGSTGAVFFEQFVQSEASLVEDIALLRSQGRAVILSVGGAGEYLNIGSPARRDAFVESVVGIYERLGGFDGLDWNIESADLPVREMVQASQALKARFGEGFAITTPPAPWRGEEMAFVEALRDAGVLDLVTPQYYDLTGLSTEAARRDHAVANISRWVEAAGGADRVGFGFRNVGPASETMTVDSAVAVWERATARHPDLRGAMVWSIDLDRSIDYRFADRMSTAIAR